MESKKTKRTGASKSHKARKRRKIDAGRETNSSRKNAKPHGTFVNVDQLAWKQVALPDRLEDAEGFFGLEEIDDVEIVRNGDVVQYKTSAY